MAADALGGNGSCTQYFFVVGQEVPHRACSGYRAPRGAPAAQIANTGNE